MARRNRGCRRKKDWHKALHKQRTVVSWGQNWQDGWYNNLHQYSKNKIHCSCPLCACKSKGRKVKRTFGPAENWCMMDRRRLDEMEQQLEEEI